MSNNRNVYEHVKQLEEKIAGLNRVNVGYAKEIADYEKKVQSLKETIKGLDRRTREYSDKCKELQERLDWKLEADAGRPVLDVNGTIEAQRGLIRKLKGDVLTLQRKVEEQDEVIASYQNEDHHDAMEN